MADPNRNKKGQFIKGHIPWSKGKIGLYKSSEKTRLKISKIHKGKHLSEEQKLKISKSHIGKKSSEETKLKLSLIHKGKKLTKDHIKKCLRKNPKSLLEIKFESIINKYNLPYKFVGNGEFFIERKCPDFININGQKIAIEVYYTRHKQQFRNGVEQWKFERSEIFNKYGWKLLFFNEVEVNEESILNKLRDGG